MTKQQILDHYNGYILYTFSVQLGDRFGQQAFYITSEIEIVAKYGQQIAVTYPDCEPGYFQKILPESFQEVDIDELEGFVADECGLMREVEMVDADVAAYYKELVRDWRVAND